LRSGAATIGAQGIMFFLQLASTMVLARVLTPEDYGINAMAVAINGFASVFSDLGLSNATVQQPEINHEQVSNLFWINVFIGFFLTIIIAASSPLAAWFYNTPALLEVMLSLSIIFTISGFSVQHSALLKRQMRFYSIAKIRVTSLLLGIIVAILASYFGLGYWALVLNTLTNVTANTLGFWYACKWVPTAPQRSIKVSSMVKFGADLVGFDVVNYFARNLDNILIGKFWGASVLGLYSKAYQLLMMPITNLRGPANSVAIPALSRLQNDPEMFKNYYLKYVSLLAFISMPLVAFMFICTEQLISILLGNQWIEASKLFKILAIAAFIQPVSSTFGVVLVSKGKSRLYLKIGVFNSFICCLSFIAGLPWGAEGIAIGYIFANYLTIIPILHYSFKDTSINIQCFFKSIYIPILSSIFMAISLYFFIEHIKNINQLISITASFIFCTCIYLFSFCIFNKGRKDIVEYFKYLRIIINK
jgi:PST family polysaccharide transporter